MASHTERRVVVTGIGVVSPFGNDLDTLWKNLVAGKCGIQRITQFDASTFDTQIAAEVRDFGIRGVETGVKQGVAANLRLTVDVADAAGLRMHFTHLRHHSRMMAAEHIDDEQFVAPVAIQVAGVGAH